MVMWRNMTDGTFIAGRASERVELAHALKSGRPELIAVYGRRRGGKTYLVPGFFAEKIRLAVTRARAAGLKDPPADLGPGLENRGPYPPALPAPRADAFEI